MLLQEFLAQSLYFTSGEMGHVFRDAWSVALPDPGLRISTVSLVFCSLAVSFSVLCLSRKAPAQGLKSWLLEGFQPCVSWCLIFTS